MASDPLSLPADMMVVDSSHSKDKLHEYTPGPTLNGHRASVAAVRFSPDGKWLATASADRTIRIWESSGEFVHELVGHMLGVNDISWCNDSRYLVSGSDDQCVCIWDALSPELLKTLRGHTNYVMCVAYSPRGNIIASGSFDESVRVWDAKLGQCLRTLPAHSDPVTSLSFSKDGTILATASFDGMMRLWDSNSGQCLATFLDDSSNAPVGAVRWTANSKYILLGTLDSRLRLVNVHASKKFTIMKTFEGHKNTKYCLVPCFLGNMGLACGSEDGSIYFWALNSNNVKIIPDAHNGAVIALHSIKLERIASGGLDGKVRLWLSASNSESII